MVGPQHNEERVLVMAPPGGEALSLRRTLQQAGLPHRVCSDLPALLEALDSGAGVVLMTEETLSVDVLRRLDEALEERAAQHAATLRLAHEQLEREVASRQRLEEEHLETSTHERRWFAQELHDGLCQQLSALSFMTASLQVRLEKKDAPPEMLERVQRIVELAERSAREGRALAHGLFAVELEEGLADALRSLAAHTAEAYRIACQVECDDEVPLGDRITQANLYRIAQEALSNAVRHGHARHVTISVEVNDVLRLRIADDGVGISETSASAGRGGIGLHTMRRRARAIGATIEIRCGAEKGTVVECRLPLQEDGASSPSRPAATST